MFGLDIARYQTVRDFNAVKKAGVEFVSVKHTDGFGLAPVQRATVQVRGCKSVGIPVGGYHFAQKGDPRKQADVFHAELQFQGALDIWPMLDIESAPALGLHWSGTEANQFARQFVDRMFELGHAKVFIYSSTSELTAMNAQRIFQDYGGRVLIWAARYGINDGKNYGVGNYTGDVHVHQFTSQGIVNGIDGRCDLNDAKINILTLGDDVSAQEVWNEPIQVRDQVGTVSARDMLMHTNYAAWEAINQLAKMDAKLSALGNQLTDSQAAVVAAISDRPTQIDMSEAHVQQLLNGFSARTVQMITRIGSAMTSAEDKEQ